MARNRFKVNPEYNYFIVRFPDKVIVSGWEYHSDARESAQDLPVKEGMFYRIHKPWYIRSRLGKNPYDPKNWIA